MAKKKPIESFDYDGGLAETLDYVLLLKETHGTEKAAAILTAQGFTATFTSDDWLSGTACKTFNDPALSRKYMDLFGVIARDLIYINGRIGMSSTEIKERLAEAKILKNHASELARLPYRRPKRDWVILKS